MAHISNTSTEIHDFSSFSELMLGFQIEEAQIKLNTSEFYVQREATEEQSMHICGVLKTTIQMFYFMVTLKRGQTEQGA